MKTDGMFFIRAFGYLFVAKDLRKHRLYFSERCGHRKHFDIGNYSFSLGREVKK
jgi:hypothetical protein